MDVLFVADVGPRVGLGHLARSLALAEAFRAIGASVSVTTPHDEYASAICRSFGFEWSALSPSTREGRALVLDGYRPFGEARRLADRAEMLVRIVDGALGDGPADLVIDVSDAAPHPLARISCVGLAYALVPSAYARPDFAARGDRAVVSLGAGASDQIVRDVVGAAREHLRTPMEVIVGPYSGGIDGSLVEARHGLGPNEVARSFHRANVGIVGAGQTLLSAAAARLPSLAVIMAENQRTQLQPFVEARALVGVIDAVNEPRGIREEIVSALRSLDDPSHGAAAAERAHALVDGRGAQRAAHAIVERLSS